MRIFRHLGLLISLLLVSIIFLGSQAAWAQQLAPATITAFEVTTVDGKPVRDAPLMAGATYRVNFTIEVAAGLKEKCVLATSLLRSSGTDRFWTLKGSYAGIEPATWQPGQASFPFNAVEGTAQLVLEGTVPADYVSESLPSGQSLHLSKPLTLVGLSLESGAVVVDRQLEVIDSSIEEYRNSLNAKKLLLADTAADPAYSNLVKALVASAEAEANMGYTDLAMTTLKAIPASGWVEPRGSTFYQWIIIGVLALLAAMSVFMLLRTRGEMSFIKRQTDNQAKNLQILAKKASRIGDSALTAGIEQVRKELQQSAGGD